MDGIRKNCFRFLARHQQTVVTVVTRSLEVSGCFRIPDQAGVGIAQSTFGARFHSMELGIPDLCGSQQSKTLMARDMLARFALLLQEVKKRWTFVSTARGQFFLEHPCDLRPN